MSLDRVVPFCTSFPLTIFVKRETLIRYLLDELYYYEEGHSNALCPVSNNNQGSLMGEHDDSAPVKRADLDACQKDMSQKVETSERNLSRRINVLEEKMDTILRIVSGSHRAYTFESLIHFY